jgi:hypothetical protein
MLTERTKSRLLTHTLSPGVISAPRAGASWKNMVSVLSAADELAACADTDQMLRRAVELARERIGLERVGLYIRDPSAPRLVMRGTWGTGARGELTDEHALYYECDPADYEQLRQIQLSGALWQYHDYVDHMAEDARVSAVIGHGWLAVTPLVAARELVGVLYNGSLQRHRHHTRSARRESASADGRLLQPARGLVLGTASAVHLELASVREQAHTGGTARRVCLAPKPSRQRREHRA